MIIENAITILREHNKWRRGTPPYDEVGNKQPYSAKDIGLAIDCVVEHFANCGDPWHKASEELPPTGTEVVCKMKGVPHTEHFVCKWDGEYWWHWGYFGNDAQGWFGLNIGWEVIEWKEI